jgi:hypothetical protein
MHCLRQTIFTSNKTIASDILWEALKQPSDGRLIWTYVDALIHSIANDELRDSFLSFSQIIATKLNVTQHIVEQLENSSLPQSEVNESAIECCLVEISCFSSILIKLRTSDISLKSLQVRTRFYGLIVQ